MVLVFFSVPACAAVTAAAFAFYSDGDANPTTALSWSELEAMAPPAAERVEGPANAQATLRLFGQPESSVRVTLFRDHHAWCPYCQKVWLWLEFRRIPYRIRKVTMRCYGPKREIFHCANNCRGTGQMYQ